MMPTRFSRSIPLAGCLSIGLAATAPVHAVPLPDINPKRPASIAASTDPAAGAGAAEPAAAAQRGASMVPVPTRRPTPPPPPEWQVALDEHMAFRLPSADRAQLTEAVRASYAGRGAAAKHAIARIQDEAAAKLAQWYYLRSSKTGATPREIEAFRRANPDWPSLNVLRLRAERALFDSSATPSEIEDFFSDTAPATPAGKAALAHAYRAKGDEDAARRLLRAAWLDPDLEHEVEKAILARDADLLREADHKARIDRLFYKDRTALVPAALRIAGLLGPEEKRKAEARAAVVRRASGAGNLLYKLPDDARAELGIVFSRAQWLRRNDREAEAWELLLSVDAEPAELLDLEEWWVERRINVRGALNRGEPQIAYDIARSHGAVSGSHYLDAEFLAGWICLRFLNDPETAMGHFNALRAASTGGQDIARAEYWIGRAEMARGNSVAAALHFDNAAQHPFHYYGQLGVQSLQQPYRAQDLFPATPQPTAENTRRWMNNDMVKAIAILRSADLEGLVPVFLFQLARTVESAGEAALTATLARRIGLIQASVRLSKIALNRGLPMTDYAYPINVLPTYQPLNDGSESALVHALSRQESEFNPVAQSPAGARGLLQLMPGTARAVARSYRVGYALGRLTAEPAYNMQLGAAHLADLVESYDGSYILSLVAYNAGPGRVRDWTERFGDPRDAAIDPIDWVERIPFTETRNYVQRVLESVQVFRARLEGPENALRLAEDIDRGRTQPHGPRSATAAAQ